ncbi:MAG TPA: carbon-nitrogen hydrolase family protein [Nocardioidaceae bacterium]|nr:carbon-nitrogen hydrolase family protein [Nocardioidaceae bacterium]
MSKLVVAAAQFAPVHLDLAASLEKARGIVADAALEGVQLLVFPESFLPGYPDWVWRTPAWSPHALASYQRLYENAVVVPGPETETLADLAREHGMHLAMGVTERHGSTLYNTLLLFGADGALLNHHRKLMPTGGERLVWGYGDGAGLTVHDTPVGRVGGLLCWENYMPLARAAIYAQDVQVYLAPTWDTSDVWVPTLQHIAKEGRTFVIGCCQAIHANDLPDDIPGKAELYGDEWLARGLSAIIAPGGRILAGPLEEKEGLVTASIDLARCAEGRGMFDPTGHYSRPDVLRLAVDTTRKSPVVRAGDPEPSAAPPRP